MKRSSANDSGIYKGFRAVRELLHRWTGASVGPCASRALLDMLLTFIASLGGRPCHDGVAGVNRIERNLWRAPRFAPPPPGTDTAHLARS